MKRNFRKYFLRIAIIVMMLFCFQAFAQQLKFNNISILQGLSQSTVNCVIQDKQGFMWMGTQDGLNKYDGYSFKYYKHDPKYNNSLPDNYVQALCEDKNGNIWIGTYGGGLSCFNKITQTFVSYKNDSANTNSISNNAVTGIVCDNRNNLWIGTQDGLNFFDLKQQKFTRYKFSANDLSSISSNKISCIYLDDKDRLWIGTADNGFNLMNTRYNTFSRFLNNGSIENSLSKNAVKVIMQDHSGMLWIGTSGGGVDHFNPVDFKFKHLKNEPGKKNSLESNDVWVIFEDRDYNIWFGSYGSGLCKYNPGQNIFTTYKNNPNVSGSLSNNIVLCAYQDYRGLFWVGTLGGGVDVFDPAKESFIHYKQIQGDKNSLSENMVMSFYEDKNKQLWIGTYGGGLNLFDPKTELFTHFNKDDKNKNSLSGDIVRCVFRDSKNNLWVGTYGGGLNLYNDVTGSFTHYKSDDKKKNTISSDDVWCIKEDREGNLWVGTWGGGLNRFDPKTKTFKSYRFNSSDNKSISNDKVISLLIDKDQRLWIGTNGGGLNKYDKNSDSFIAFKNDIKDTTSISSDRVRCIHEDTKGNIWIGTDGGGLNKFDVAANKFLRITEEEGLPNNVVYGILEDEAGNLWLSTNNGICKYNPKKNTFQKFDVRDGLQSNEFNQGAYCKTANGKFYFGGVNGFNAFNPASIQRNPNRPPVYITSIKLFGKEIESDTVFSFQKTLKLNYTDNFLSFEFAALDYTASDKNQYACMMEGFDNDWIQLGNMHFVSYTNLDPGKYVFKIKASNNDNVWNEQGNYIMITITPPFWKTYWFYFLVIIFILTSIYFYINQRTKKLQRDKEILEQEVVVRTKEVVNQKDIIEKKNKDITDSIRYAKRIQQAILPSEKIAGKLFPDSFVLYKPKDIVSGDFYWMEQFGSLHFFSVVDCTGHGVPGAFMSIVGHNLLNQAVNEPGMSSPSLILNAMNKGLSKQLHQQLDEVTIRDGMDIALCCIDTNTKLLQYAGANNPLWIIRNNTLIVIKADKHPIGIFLGESLKPFTNHEFQLQEGDLVYIFSDGYADQFGGPAGKKFKYKPMQELLLSVVALSMNEQHDILNNTIENWRGDLEQVDDILIIGVRI